MLSRRALVSGAAVALVSHRAAAQADAAAIRRALLGGVPPWVLRGNGIAASVDLDFLDGQYYQAGSGSSVESLITASRASTGTNLLPTSASGFAYSSFGNNIARITPGSGLLVEEARTNRLLNSAAPATQTTASLATGAYTLWVNGSGTATPSAGTATLTGITAATQGSPGAFTVSVAGTVVVTVSGSLNAFQLELGAFGTSLIVTAGATATRAADVVTLTNVPVFGGAYTLFGKGTPIASDADATNKWLAVVTDGTANNRIGALRNSAVAKFFIAAGGTTVLNAGSSAWTQGASGKVAVSYAASNQAATFNAAAPSTSSSALVPSGLSVVDIGNLTNGFFYDGTIERIALWPTTRLPNAALVSLTT